MIKKISTFIENHYSTLVCLCISAYFVCALEVSTMIHYLPVLPLLLKLVRYAIYAALLILWGVEFCSRESVSKFSDFFSKFTLWLVNHLFFCLIAFIAIMIYLTSGSLIPFALLLMFGVMQYVKTEKVLKWIFFTQTITAVGIILLSLVGVIENLGYPTFLRGIRYSFGYIFPLELHVHFLILSLMYLYLYPKQHGWKSFLGISVLNFVLYHFTIARTSFILAEFAAIMSLIIALLPSRFKDSLCRWKSWRYLIPGLTVFVFLFFIFLCLAYNPDLLAWERLDDMLSGRLRLGQSALQTYPLTLFGQTVKWLGSGGPEGVYVWESAYNYVDNSYIKDLIDNGIIFWTLEILGYIWLQLRMLRSRNLMGFTIIWVFFILGMMEPRLVLIPFNFLLLLFGPACLASNVQVETWISKLSWIRDKTRELSVWQKALFVSLLGILLVFGFFRLREQRIRLAREKFADQLIDHRDQYTRELWMSESSESEDPFNWRSTIYKAVESTDSYEKKVYQFDKRNLSDEAFGKISELDEQTIERIYQKLVNNQQGSEAKTLNEIKNEVEKARLELE
ncbi:hypothetical protein [Ileibacterium valens]|uniref:hypothetical protein n=2 Tax=Ileibacterium valens TaxID=1862668 RepID=UPI00272A4E35|nr:hypothetical protein [Ileibacterium valens]